jgi:hypothetical protein
MRGNQEVEMELATFFRNIGVEVLKSDPSATLTDFENYMSANWGRLRRRLSKAAREELTIGRSMTTVEKASERLS